MGGALVRECMFAILSSKGAIQPTLPSLPPSLSHLPPPFFFHSSNGRLDDQGLYQLHHHSHPSSSTPSSPPPSSSHHTNPALARAARVAAALGWGPIGWIAARPGGGEGGKEGGREGGFLNGQEVLVTARLQVGVSLEGGIGREGRKGRGDAKKEWTTHLVSHSIMRR